MHAMTALILLFAGTQPVHAGGLDERMLNLFYFEYARTSADHCEERGFPSRSIFQDWEKRNIHIQRKLVAALTDDLKNKGLNSQQAEQQVQEIQGLYRGMSLEEISKNRVPCKVYREFISGFDKLPQSAYGASP